MFAVHFGAGNIGRGFIGSILYKSGFETVFVDVNEVLINELNKKKSYTVVLADETSEEQRVENVSGINSQHDAEAVKQAIAKADLVTTAVGPHVLPVISKLLAQALKERRKTNDTPLNIIACENMIGASTLLRDKVYNHINKEEQKLFDQIYGFPNAAVDRIVPNQTNKELLTVAVEPYFEWVVEETDIKANKPNVDGVTYVPDLTPYIERKLFTVNTGHAAAAYFGHYFGCETIKQAMDDSKIVALVRGALKESGAVLVQKYGFNELEHQQYIDKIIQRFMNPNISDDVTRVGRAPKRKLGPHDRLIEPAKAYMGWTKKEPVHLAKVIAATLLYRNGEDKEAMEINQQIEEIGIVGVLEKISGLSKDDPLIRAVEVQVDQLKKT